ncbi:MAG: hypothetical protein MPK62_11305, partial [Alphaproteobacteria bacterium]|nr:hypothetical protein [Alphaproteobacteria bacterium]
CHYFVVILSDHYHRGAYTDHEFGMAVMSKRKIRVINIDGTRAYGFIEKYHYRNISEIMDKADGSMFEAVNLIFHKDKEILLPFLLKGFCHSKSFDITRLFNSRLERLDYKFDITELNKIATAYINNHEIHDAVQIEYMMKILEKSLDKIKPELAVKIKNGFKCDWSSGHTVTPFYENQNFLQND